MSLDSSTDLGALTRVVYGEARGESDEGRRGVAWTVKNRSKKSGKVFIQGFNIDHYSIIRASMNDYIGFYNEESPTRKLLKYLNEILSLLDLFLNDKLPTGE